MNIKKEINNHSINQVLLIIFLSSFLLPQFSISVGFSLKPYMIVGVVVFIGLIVKQDYKLKYMNGKFQLYEIFFLLFIMYATIRNCFSDDVLLAFKGTIALMFSVCTYYITYFFFSDVSKENTIKYIYKSGFLSLIIILLGYILKDENIFLLDRAVNRLRGYVQDPNFFALYFILPALVIIFTLIRTRKLKILSILSVIALFLSYSRAGYISIILGTLYMLYNIRKDIKRFYLNTSLASLALAATLWFVDLMNIAPNWWDNLFNNIMMRFTETASRGAREQLITIGIDTFLNNPIFGVGMLNVQYYTYNIVHNNYLHNTYLEVFVEQGIIGGALYLGFILSFIFVRSKSLHSKVLKSVILCQLMMIFFLTAVNNEALFLSLGLYKALNSENVK